MDDENWFTVGKPKKVKSGENKAEIGEEIGVNFCPLLFFCVYF